MAGCGVAQGIMRRISGVSVVAYCKAGAGSIPPCTSARLSSQQALIITQKQKKLRLRRETQQMMKNEDDNVLNCDILKSATPAWNHTDVNVYKNIQEYTHRKYDIELKVMEP